MDSLTLPHRQAHSRSGTPQTEAAALASRALSTSRRSHRETAPLPAEPLLEERERLVLEREAALREYHRLTAMLGDIEGRIEELDASIAASRREERERAARRYTFD